MSFCSDNQNKIMQYVKKSIVTSYALLSKRTATKVFNSLRTKTVLADKANIKLISRLEKEDVVVYPKFHSFANDRKCLTDPITTLDLRQPEEFAKWIATEGFQQDGCTVIKHFNWIQGNWLKNVNLNIHFEKGNCIWFTRNWPANVTIGRVSEIKLKFVPTSDIPIYDKRSVEAVHFRTSDSFDLTFLKQFMRLKRLDVSVDNGKSLSKPFLPYLEELQISHTSVVINTENLRYMRITCITIDEAIVGFIAHQTRLLYLDVYGSTNMLAIRFPSSLKALKWEPIIEEDTEEHAKYLAENCKQLKLRKFKTKVKLKTIDWLDKKKVEQWRVNDVRKRKAGNKWVLEIVCYYDGTLPYLCCSADECVVKTDDLSALRLVDKATPRLTLEFELKGNTEGTPVLEAVTDLTIEYEVTDDQAKLLARILPQFTESKLKTKGIVN